MDSNPLPVGLFDGGFSALVYFLGHHNVIHFICSCKICRTRISSVIFGKGRKVLYFFRRKIKSFWEWYWFANDCAQKLRWINFASACFVRGMKKHWHWKTIRKFDLSESSTRNNNSCSICSRKDYKHLEGCRALTIIAIITIFITALITEITDNNRFMTTIARFLIIAAFIAEVSQKLGNWKSL